MTDTTSTQSTPSTPKKSFKKFFWIVAIILGLFGLDHYTYNFVGIGAEVTVTDSSIMVTPSVDTVVTVPVAPAVVDTTKADTTKK